MGGMAIRRLVFLILLSVLRLGYCFRANAFGYGRSFQPLTLVEPPFTPVEPPYVHHKEPLGPAFAPAPSPEFSAQTVGAVRHRHQNTPPAHSPSFKFEHDCTGFFCSEPLTLAPLGTPCACVLPMKVEIELGVAAFWVFTLVAELAVEIATGTYVKQSQVRVVAAVSSGIGQEKTRVLIHLLPLGERFDRMSAFLISDRFWRKEIPINSSLFGDYKVLFVAYPGIPASVPYHKGSGDHDIPFAARLPTKRSKKMNPRIIAAVASSSLIFAVLCATVACIILKAKKNGNSSAKLDPLFLPPVKKQSGTKFMISSSMASTTSLSLASTVATCPSSIKTFTMAELELATSQFSPKKVLGEGGFGCVYHGIIDDGSEVAVKLLKRQDENGDREFISEIEMLSRLHHRNLVKLLGICIEGCARCLVYELVRNGSVESHLYDADKKRGHLDWDTRVKIALGSARALAYLHEDSNPRVIHRDFKASNILLEDDFTPRVSDFGLARVAGEGSHHVSTHVMGTFGYVAPEYAMTGHLLVKSDVYSYGVVLLELLSGRKPVDMSRPPGQENLVTWARSLLASKEGLAQLVDPSLEGKYDFDSLAKVAAIAAMCVQPEVSHRPFMGEVVQALKLLSNDRYDGCEDIHSHRDSCIADCDEFKIETNTEGSWWERPAPLDAVRGASSYMTMEYNSSPPDEMAHAPLSPSLVTRMNSSVRLNRSGPLRTERNMDAFAKLRGCESEHGLPSRYPAVGY